MSHPLRQRINLQHKYTSSVLPLAPIEPSAAAAECKATKGRAPAHAGCTAGGHLLAQDVAGGALPLAHAQAVAPVALCLDDAVLHWPRHADERHALSRADRCHNQPMVRRTRGLWILKGMMRCGPLALPLPAPPRQW